MEAFKQHAPAQALAKWLTRHGGRSAEDALSGAQAALAGIEHRALAEIDADLGEIDAVCAQPGFEGDEKTVARAYVASGRVIGLAGLFGLGELGQAACSLCDLLSHIQAGGRADAVAVRVHLDGLRMLRRPATPETAGARQAILEGLRAVAHKRGAG